jgi:PAS domain S-box-containing protein
MGSSRKRVEKGIGPIEEPVSERSPAALDGLLRALIDGCPAFIYLKDEQLRHVYANRRLIESFGATASEFAGSRSSDFLPAEHAREVERVDRQVLSTRKTAPVTETRVELGGKVVWVRDVKFPVEGPDGELAIAGLALDVTERVQAERALAEELGFASLVADLAASLGAVGASDFEPTIDRCLEKLGRFLRVERAFVARFGGGGESFPVTNLWCREGLPRGASLGGEDLAQAGPWVAQQIRQGAVIKIDSGSPDLPPEARRLRRYLESQGVNSGVVVPMRVGGEAIGLLGVDTVDVPRDYPDAMVERLRLLADLIGSTLRRTVAEIEVERLRARLERENVYLRREIEAVSGAHAIVGESPTLRRVLDEARQVAATDSTVLIGGETGTGKELLARLIHDTSDRGDRPLVKVNCAALPETLVENELFGRERGAYTGALTRQPGRFEVADGSTLFLDEVGDLPVGTQMKLLRVLEQGELERLGSSKTVRVDVRVIAATNRDLQAEVEAGRFREDLFYRLSVFPLTMPPLRDRPGDVRLLTWAFLREFATSMGKPIDDVSADSMSALEAYPWPGNVRELRNVIERAMILCRGPTLEVVPPAVPDASGKPGGGASFEGAQRQHILSVLEATGWRVRGEGGAAEILGMKPTTLDSRMKRLGIRRPS